MRRGGGGVGRQTGIRDQQPYVPETAIAAAFRQNKEQCPKRALAVQTCTLYPIPNEKMACAGTVEKASAGKQEN